MNDFLAQCLKPHTPRGKVNFLCQVCPQPPGLTSQTPPTHALFCSYEVVDKMH